MPLRSTRAVKIHKHFSKSGVIHKSHVTQNPPFIVSASQVPSIWNKIYENKVKHSSRYLWVQAAVQPQNKKNTTVLLWTERRAIADIFKLVTKYICSIMDRGRSFWACDLEGSVCVCVWGWESNFWAHVSLHTAGTSTHKCKTCTLKQEKEHQREYERFVERRRDKDHGCDSFIGSPGVRKSSPSYRPWATHWGRDSQADTSYSLCVCVRARVKSVSEWPRPEL